MNTIRTGEKVQTAYYLQEDVVALSRDLLGKLIFTRIDGQLTGGMITETEAYAGVTDRASHAYGGRHTERTSIMFRTGGTAYIYLCYGVHSLFNIVTNAEGVPHAILVRGIFPLIGTEVMFQRAAKTNSLLKLGNGPGKVSKILGLHYSLSGTLLTSDKIWLEYSKLVVPDDAVFTGPRIGVDYAGEHALWPYRFQITDPEQLISNAGNL